MSGKLTGKFILSVEYGSESGKPWMGSISVPKKLSKSAKFELFSENAIYSTQPFCQLESHSRSVVRGWVNSNRPITLISPFVNHIGGGSWAEGYRQSSVIKGMVSAWVEDEHLQGGSVKEIFEVGFTSGTLNFFCNQKLLQASPAGSLNYFSQSAPSKYAVELTGIGDLTLTRLSSVDESKRHFSRSFTRLVNGRGLTIWQAIQFCRLQIALLDFLAGKPEGELSIAILGARALDSPLRLKTFERGHSEQEVFQTRAIIEDPIKQFLMILSRLWHDENLKQQLFAVTTLSNASLGLMERFTRTTAYLERFLADRFKFQGQQLRKTRYTQGVNSYLTFLRSGSSEVIDFAEEFARPSYPKEATLRELLYLAIEECRPLGLFSQDKYEIRFVQLRNEVFHGEERSETSWIKDVQYATEFGIAVLELLIAKNLGLNPPITYQPRNDILRVQLGILG